jgi:hypothetical protein
MPKPELLPGVTSAACPPDVVCDARGTIRMARRRAVMRDAAQVTLLLAVDYLFMRWPDARVPFLDRNQSLTMLEFTNAAVAAHLWWSRVLLPRWAAKRIASTWSRVEQQRFTR